MLVIKLNNMNNKLIELLNKLQIAATNVYRARAFENAIKEIKSLNYSICPKSLGRFQRDVAEKKITGIGIGIMDRIVEFCDTGRIAEVAKLIAKTKAMKILCGIRGVGPTQAEKWIHDNIYNLTDLRRAIRQKDITLTDEQKYGLRYYTDLNTRIPRREVAEYVNHLRSQLAKLTPQSIDVVGSYRRGLPDCGDVDILLCFRGAMPPINRAIRDEFSIVHAIKDEFFIAIMSQGENSITYLYRSHSAVRQCDILLTNPASYVAALVYFTGSKAHCIALRRRAKQLGYKLNQKGLFRGEKAIALKTEEDLYRRLKLDYVDPKNRS